MMKKFTQILIALIAMFLVLHCVAIGAKPKSIALTFDDGPNAKYTEEILNLLDQHHAKATFFVTGGSVKAYPEILKKVFDQGNVIGNHSYSHPLITKLSSNAFAKELNNTNQTIYRVIHVYPVLFRPPYGMSNARSNAILQQLGYKKITWDYMVNDYEANKTTAIIIATNVIKHARPGAIITMHDGGNNREKTVQALSQILTTLSKEGYHFVTVSELRGIKPYRTNIQ